MRSPKRQKTATSPPPSHQESGQSSRRRMEVLRPQQAGHQHQELEQWHPGERAVQALLQVPHRGRNPTHHDLPAFLGQRVAESPLVAVGALDARGRPWVSVWGGEKGFCAPIAEDVLGFRVDVGVKGGEGGDHVTTTTMRTDHRDGRISGIEDPVVSSLFGEGDGDHLPGGPAEGEPTSTRDTAVIRDRVVRPAGGKVVAGLSIDLETRDRVKLAGRMVAGVVGRGKQQQNESEVAATEKRDEESTPVTEELQMMVQVDESLGNCPKYLNKKHILPHTPRPTLVASRDDTAGNGGGQKLPQGAVEVIHKADLFFIASKHISQSTTAIASTSMDVNHRGGSPGFVQILHNDGGGSGDGGISLIYPEFSGNRLYQTLGNVATDPQVGIVIPDFETSDVLYLTGTATILTGNEAMRYLGQRTKVALRIDVDAFRFVTDGLSFRGEWIDYSPYNPGVRRLVVEGKEGAVDGDEADGGVATARLWKREKITDGISRYVFKLTPKVREETGRGDQNQTKSELPRATRMKPWQAGQHVTFDFGPELDNGWSHMADSDPQSLNDDYVRTFTVSAPPSLREVDLVQSDGDFYIKQGVEPEVEITVRRHGPATALLARWNHPAVPLEIPILGFGGDEAFRLVPRKRTADGKEQHGYKTSVFVAGGVGITPVLAQAGAMLASNDSSDGDGGSSLRLLWSLKSEDLAFALDVMKRIPGLARVTRLFITGGVGEGGSQAAAQALREGHTAVEDMLERRMGKEDILSVGQADSRKYYCCTGPAMMKTLLQWMTGEEVVFESFEY